MGLPISFLKSKKPRGRTRCHAGQMNKTEAAYARYLDLLKSAQVVDGWWWDAISLRLAENTHYRPDFLVMRRDGTLEIHEVKGFMEDDSWVKIKTIAELYPFPVWVVRKKKGTKEEWTWQEVGGTGGQPVVVDAVAAAAARIKNPASLAWPK